MFAAFGQRPAAWSQRPATKHSSVLGALKRHLFVYAKTLPYSLPYDKTKATDANYKKLLSNYTDDEIFKVLERKYKSPLRCAIDLDAF